MSPSKKITASNDLFTAILALAVGIVVATSIFVMYKTHSDYGKWVIWKIEAAR